MNETDYLCPAEAEAYSRFSRDSGTYYVDGSRKSNWKRYICVLLLLLLLLLVCGAAVCGYLLYKNEPVDNKLVNCTIGQVNIPEFSEFQKKYERSPSSRTCEKLSCFADNVDSAVRYQGLELIGNYLGNTEFSDMCLAERQQYQSGRLAAEESDLHFNSSTFPESYNVTDKVPPVVYNDSLGLTNNTKAALLQWYYHGKTANVSKEYENSAAFIKDNIHVPLQKLKLASPIIEKQQTPQAQVAIYGPFATEGQISDAFFFIREKVFPDELCLKSEIPKTNVAVIVVGYEKSGDSNDWYIQPVGEKWHNHVENGYKSGKVVKISDKCYRNTFKHLFGFNISAGKGNTSLTYY